MLKCWMPAVTQVSAEISLPMLTKGFNFIHYITVKTPVYFFNSQKCV